jgi:uncharacterized protein YhbP (UPF0306 family)
MEKRITDFIKKHHVLTLATSFEGMPWVANCFYAYMEGENAFVFSSAHDTKHIKDLSGGNIVAASIVLETSVVGKIQGIQIRGRLLEAMGEIQKPASGAYMKRFPFTVLMETTLWVLEVEYVKMTDNRLGFGKKLIWEKGNMEKEN